jgi:hypothetical protein
MDELQAQVEAHNTRTLWDEIAGRLATATHELGLVEGLLDDLDAPHLSGNLTPLIEGIERFQALANDKATA